MHHDRRCVGIAALAPALAAGVLLSIPALAQAPASAPPQEEAPRVPAGVSADDSALPAPEDLNPQTDSRRFVESFLVSMLGRDPDLVFDTYLHSTLQEALGREKFRSQLTDVTGAAGEAQRLVVLYLREENARYDGADGGWAEYTVIAERDPQVKARVDFRRGGDGKWKVYDYSLQSAQLERLQRARAAAEAELRSQEAAPSPAEPPSHEP